jgi:rhomboid protease GluP
MAKQERFVDISTEGLSPAHVLVFILHAASQLKWSVQHLHPMRVALHVPNKGFSGVAQVQIRPSEKTMRVSSSTVGWAPFASKDRHDGVLQVFTEQFALARMEVTPDQLQEELKELEGSGILAQDASTIDGDKLRLKDIGSLFVPKPGFFTSAILIDLNILVFLIMAISGVNPLTPDVEDVFNWGGNYRPATVGGEWWRLLTSCFLHFGILHLAMNIYAFMMVAVQLEPLLGRWRMLSLYLLSGIFASAASLWWNDNTVSAGASGAVFGMYGVFLALLMTNLIHKDVRRPLLNSIGVFVIYNLIYGMKGDVDNAAHIGGLLSGLLFGVFSYLSLKKPEIPAIRMMSIGLPTLLLTVLSAVAISPLRNDDMAYEARLQAFYDNQQQGMTFFEMSGSGTANDELVEEIEKRSLPAWYANRELLYSLEGMDLSEVTRARHLELVRYCDLRIEHYDLIRLQLKGASVPHAEQRYAQVEQELNDLLADMNEGSDDTQE